MKINRLISIGLTIDENRYSQSRVLLIVSIFIDYYRLLSVLINEPFMNSYNIL